MLEAIVHYNNYDTKIREVTLPLNEGQNQVIKIQNTEVNEEILVPETLFDIQVVDVLTEEVVSTKIFTKVELSNYIKLLQRLLKETAL